MNITLHLVGKQRHTVFSASYRWLFCAFLLLSPRITTSFVPVVPMSATPQRNSRIWSKNTSTSNDKTRSIPTLGPNSTSPGFIRRVLPGFPWHRLPNFLTYARCLAIPGLAVVFYRPDFYVETASLFAAASFTDWLDGYLARRWDIVSDFGAFLDPVADKLMVSTALILLSGRYGATVAVPSAIILAREIAVSALREWMAQRGERDTVKVGFQGKCKTALTMLALSFLLLAREDGIGFLGKFLQPALVLLYLSAGITVTSGSIYFRAAAPVLMAKNK